MKSELLTAIGTAIIGILVAFFVCNLLIGDIQPVSFKKLGSTIDASVSDPDPEVFNYDALNPTVEVYVNGECNSYDDCEDQGGN